MHLVTVKRAILYLTQLVNYDDKMNASTLSSVFVRPPEFQNRTKINLSMTIAKIKNKLRPLFKDVIDNTSTLVDLRSFIRPIILKFDGRFYFVCLLTRLCMECVHICTEYILHQYVFLLCAYLLLCATCNNCSACAFTIHVLLFLKFYRTELHNLNF